MLNFKRLVLRGEWRSEKRMDNRFFLPKYHYIQTTVSALLDYTFADIWKLLHYSCELKFDFDACRQDW